MTTGNDTEVVGYGTHMIEHLQAENARLRMAMSEAKDRLSRGQPDRSEQSREALLILSLALIDKP